MKSKLLTALAILVVLGIGVFIYLRSMRQVAQVAEIAGSTCTSNLLTFQATKSCSADGFSQYTYSCKQSANNINATSPGCISFRTAYNDAMNKCGTECVEPPRPTSTSVATVTPTPSVVGTSTPTPKPTTVATCQPRPACLDAKVPCKLADKPGMYCPTPAPTCVPYPTCRPGGKCAVPALAKGRVYCSTPTPSPVPTCVPYPCPAGARCKLPQLSDGRTYCAPVPAKCRVMLFGRYCVMK